MYKKPCKCGLSEKTFKNDIGPYFTNDCCEKADASTTAASTEPVITLSEANVDSTGMPGTAILASQKLSKTKLRDMPVEILKEIARLRGVEGSDSLSKKQLVEALRS